MAFGTGPKRHVRTVLSVALAAGCAPPVDVAAPQVAAPEVVYAGCEAVQTGPVCSLRPDATLRLWVPGGERLVLERDGEALPVRWISAEGGQRTALTAVTGESLTLRSEAADWRWTLRLRPAAGLPAALRDIDEQSRTGDHAGAMAALTIVMPDLRGAEHAEAIKLRGDLLQRRGEATAALATYEEAFTAAVDAGLLGRASEVALTACYTAAVQQQDHAAARRWLARHAELLNVLPEARLHHAYFAGLLADRTGDLRTAARRYEEQARLARAIGLERELFSALLGLASLRGRLGDTEGAEAAFAEALALTDLPDEARAVALHNAAWFALEARARGQVAADPEPRFAAALAMFSPGHALADPNMAAEARLNLAYAQLLRGDAAAARATLAGFEPKNHANRRWRLYLEGRADLLVGDPAGALEKFVELAALAIEAGDRGLEWSAAVGEGEAQEQLGHSELAVAAYQRAAALHAAELAAIAVDAGRERFAAERDRGAQRLVRLLLQLGRADEALCAARLARVQAFAGLAAAAADPAALAEYRAGRVRIEQAVEATWDLPQADGEAARARLKAERRDLDERLDAAFVGGPASAGCDQLRVVAAGELLLVYYPIEAGWAAFARDEATLTTTTWTGPPADDDDARARQLLAPFAGQIGRAGQLRVAASGSLSAAALHTLPWQGARLLDAAPVVYTLDLPPRARAHTPGRRAVQLAPPGNLAGADTELTAAADALTAAAWSVELLRGDEPDLLGRMAGADLLHHVGHARGDGWDGALALGGDRRLGVGDLLSVRGPRYAVLSGCETGLLDPRAHAGGMSLAHALLLAGADAVIATDAVVDDAVATAVAPLIIRGIAAGEDPAAALRAVQQARPDAARFRAFAP